LGVNKAHSIDIAEKYTNRLEIRIMIYAARNTEPIEKGEKTMKIGYIRYALSFSKSAQIEIAP